MNIQISTYRPWLYAGILALLAPALLINLGELAFIDDESIRALVALEMKLSGNYITPTLHGEYYYNKPPLWNWILLLFFGLTGKVNEFTARIPTVFCLLGYGATIYYFFRKHYSRKVAFLNAFFFITCGRVLFWDSILALIDTCFSWATFTAFMVVYHHFQKENWLKLFLLSYLLTAAGFLMKGLPAVVFQGTTLLAYFAYRRRFWKLFSWQHVVGGLSFLLIVGGYYLIYHQYNSLENVFSTLFRESSKRTVVNFGLWNTIGHFFTFPFEMVYHFLPWSLMILYFIHRDVLAKLRADSFITFNLVVFLANILVYWTSPEVYPRYLLMLAPLIFSAYIYLHDFHEANRTWQYRLINVLFFIFCIAAAVLAFVPLFVERPEGIPYRYAVSLAVGLTLSGLAYLYWRWKQERLLVLIAVLLTFRIGFNWFVLPDRNDNDFGDLCRQTTKDVAEEFKGREMAIYKQTLMQPTNSFYLTNGRGAIVPRKSDNFDKDILYIIDPHAYRELKYQKVGEFKVRHGKLTYEVGLLK
ncbi:MAG: glycosyltransferase family 39 protein [Phaeodactylibacter sp.]|nr:glycosyltransferase family 39 protein [Phaeodactylibacter sp.]MCB9053015.1 glycosyltransferase family 39 protein [Lewinellaceae bacterium]